MWNKVSFIIRSKCRKEVLAVLSESPLTPSAIAKKTNFHLSHTSRALQELKDRNFVECLTDAHKGKIYRITREGKYVLDRIRKTNL